MRGRWKHCSIPNVASTADTVRDAPCKGLHEVLLAECYGWAPDAPAGVVAYVGNPVGCAAAALVPLGVVVVGATGHTKGSCSILMAALCVQLGIFAIARL